MNFYLEIVCLQLVLACVVCRKWGRKHCIQRPAMKQRRHCTNSATLPQLLLLCPQICALIFNEVILAHTKMLERMMFKWQESIAAERSNDLKWSWLGRFFWPTLGDMSKMLQLLFRRVILWPFKWELSILNRSMNTFSCSICIDSFHCSLYDKLSKIKIWS